MMWPEDNISSNMALPGFTHPSSRRRFLRRRCRSVDHFRYHVRTQGTSEVTSVLLEGDARLLYASAQRQTRQTNRTKIQTIKFRISRVNMHARMTIQKRMSKLEWNAHIGRIV